MLSRTITTYLDFIHLSRTFNALVIILNWLVSFSSGILLVGIVFFSWKKMLSIFRISNSINSSFFLSTMMIIRAVSGIILRFIFLVDRITWFETIHVFWIFIFWIKRIADDCIFDNVFNISWIRKRLACDRFWFIILLLSWTTWFTDNCPRRIKRFNHWFRSRKLVLKWS